MLGSGWASPLARRAWTQSTFTPAPARPPARTTPSTTPQRRTGEGPSASRALSRDQLTPSSASFPHPSSPRTPSRLLSVPASDASTSSADSTGHLGDEDLGVALQDIFPGSVVGTPAASPLASMNSGPFVGEEQGVSPTANVPRSQQGHSQSRGRTQPSPQSRRLLPNPPQSPPETILPRPSVSAPIEWAQQPHPSASPSASWQGTVARSARLPAPNPTGCFPRTTCWIAASGPAAPCAI